MRLSPRRTLIALCGCAFLAALHACAQRPLSIGEDGGSGGGGGSDPGNPGQAGDNGTSCSATNPGLELIGAPLLVLDSPATSGNLYPTLLWTGAEYLFVWRHVGGDGIFMQRIDASGQPVGGNQRVRAYENACDLAWGNARLAAVWPRVTATTGDSLMFQTFDRFGRPMIDAVTVRSAVRMTNDASVLYGPRIAPIAGGFAIAWYEGQVYVATVDLAGNLMQQPVVAGGSDLLAAPAVSIAATVNDRILVGSAGRTESSPAPTPGVMVTRAFGAALAPLGSARVLGTVGFSGGHQVLATESGFIALWGQETSADSEVRIARLDAAGAQIAASTLAPPVVGAYRNLAPAAWNRDHVVALWVDDANDLTLSRFTPAGVRQGPSINLPTMARADRLYLVAHDGTVGFIWSEEIAGAQEVYFQQARSCP